MGFLKVNIDEIFWGNGLKEEEGTGDLVLRAAKDQWESEDLNDLQKRSNQQEKAQEFYDLPMLRVYFNTQHTQEWSRHAHACKTKMQLRGKILGP